MKKVMLAALGVALSMGVNAQLKVDANGHVGVHTTVTQPQYSLNIQQVNGVSSYGGCILMNGYNKTLRLGQFNANAHIGSSSDAIAFYTANTSYNHVYFSGYTISSDISLKTNIEPLTNNLEVLMKFKPKSYFLEQDFRSKEPKITYGFIAQEVNEFQPGLVDTCNGVMGISYHQIIPMLVGGVQEQQAQIEAKDEMIAAQQDEINELKDLVYQFAESAGVDVNDQSSKPAAVLYQNQPNPFKDRTVINYELPEEYSSASIMIFDMTGEMLEMYPVSKNDGGSLTIEGRQYKPGMYLYSLIVDDVEVDTKRMILSK